MQAIKYQLVRTLVASNDLEWRNSIYFALFDSFASWLYLAKTDPHRWHSSRVVSADS